MLASLALSTIGGIGLWSVVVALPVIEAEFGAGRGGASLPYTATMLGFAFGGVLMGRLADRFGIMVPVMLGALMIGLGYVVAAQATELWQFTLAQALLIGLLGQLGDLRPAGRRRLAVVRQAPRHRGRGRGERQLSRRHASGRPLLQAAIATWGWRQAHVGIGLFCVVTMLPLAFALRRRPPLGEAAGGPARVFPGGLANVRPGALQALLVLAGLACCIAMSMPQVHIVAYCADLGYGPARGAEMLSLMLGAGVISRLASGLIADRIGGVRTLLLGSTLQCVALLFYLPFDGLASLYVVSALFGLSQGGIVPSYALIVRDYFPAREAGARVSLVLMATVVGMAAGGFLSGAIYDLTGSYQAAFLNGIAWNLVNLGVALWLLLAGPRRQAVPA